MQNVSIIYRKRIFEESNINVLIVLSNALKCKMYKNRFMYRLCKSNNVASLQKSPLLGKFRFALYLSLLKTQEYDYFEEHN